MLVGEGDEATPPELAREIAAGISGSRLVIVPDSGHLSTLEKPEAVNTGARRMDALVGGRRRGATLRGKRGRYGCANDGRNKTCPRLAGQGGTGVREE